MASYTEVPCEVISVENDRQRADCARTTDDGGGGGGGGASVGGAVAYSNSTDKQPAAVAVLPPSLGDPVDAKPGAAAAAAAATRSWPRIELRGREVVLAISVFFLFSVSAGVGIILVKMRFDSPSPPLPISPTSPASPSPSPSCPVARPLCLSQPCLSKAAQMLATMDRRVDPCADFWRYACGGWLAAHAVPAGRRAWSVDSEVVAAMEATVRQLVEAPLPPPVGRRRHSANVKVKLAYSACMDVDDIERRGPQPLLDVLASFGGWAIDPAWTPAAWSLQRAVGLAHFTYLTNVLFTTWVAPDDKAAKRNVIQFDQSGLGMDDSTYYTANSSDRVVRGYKRYMRSVARLVYPSVTASRVDDFVRQTFEFEQRLAQIFQPETSDVRRDPEAMYDSITLRDLYRLTNRKFNWLTFVQNIQSNATWSSVVLITSRSYMHNLSKIISNTNDTVLNYYVLWRVAHRFVRHLSLPFRKAALRFEESKTGSSRPLERWHYCLGVVNQWMGMAVGAIFVPDHFPEASRLDVEQMIDNIIGSLRISFDGCSWMDERTRRNAKAKLAAMSYKIGYPKFITNMTEVDDIYRTFNISERDKHFEMELSNMACISERMRDALSKPADPRHDWEMNPHEVNAYYSPTTNQMVFPAGILQNPYYNKHVPMYINYGGIGTTIGHELTHGFDDYGSQFDKDGKLEKWWSRNSWAQFEKRTRCVSELYSNRSVNGLPVNGKLTLGENIADIGGILQSYQAFKKAEKKFGIGEEMPGFNLSNDQLFFLSYGQNWCSKRRPESMRQYILMNVHAPSEIRAVVPLSQVKQFAEAFSCPSGTLMNTPDRCVVW